MTKAPKPAKKLVPQSGQLPAVRSGAAALGALALGAFALGAAAYGAVAIGRLIVGKARVRTLEIDELIIKRFSLGEPDSAPRQRD